MSEEGKFWAFINTLIVIVVISITVSITIVSNHRTSEKAELIKVGINPIAVNCAISMPDGSGKLLCANIK